MASKLFIDGKQLTGAIANALKINCKDKDGNKSTVQAELNKLNNEVSEQNKNFDELEENMTKHTLGQYISISSYNSASNTYTCPCDGYVRSSGAANANILGHVVGEPGPMMSVFGTSNSGAACSLFVRRGTLVYGWSQFIPLE